MKNKIQILFIILFIILAANLVNAQDNYASGKILVSFNEGVTKIDADNLINSYNLEFSIMDLSLNNITKILATIIVPEGEEQKWIDTFEKEAIVEDAEFNLIYYTQDSDKSAGKYSSYLIPAGVIAVIILLIIIFFVLRKKKQGKKRKMEKI